MKFSHFLALAIIALSITSTTSKFLPQDYEGIRNTMSNLGMNLMHNGVEIKEQTEDFPGVDTLSYVGKTAEVYFTNYNQHFEQQEPAVFELNGAEIGGNKIVINETEKYQTITGFGAALTDSSAYLFNNLNQTQRTQILTQLFDRSSGIGVSYIRLPISATDFSLTNYTYDDMPAGQTDPTMEHFTIAHDLEYIIPILLEILAINPDLSIVITPWSPPAWMKNTDILLGTYNGVQGSVYEQYYSALALYFVRTIQAYKSQGITITSMTIQNEPLYGPTTYPGNVMPAINQTLFINQYLVPALTQANIKVNVMVYDHNWDTEVYPDTVLSGLTKEAYDYVYGTAWHCYGGNASNQTVLQEKFPDKPCMVTECSGGYWNLDWNNSFIWDMQNLMIGGVNNWSQGTIKWNIALDQNLGPQNHGCANCIGLIMINTTDNNNITYNVDYYTVGVMSKFVPPGSVRVNVTSTNGNLLTTAFVYPNKITRALIVFNQGNESQDVTITWGKISVSRTIPPITAAHYVW